MINANETARAADPGAALHPPLHRQGGGGQGRRPADDRSRARAQPRQGRAAAPLGRHPPGAGPRRRAADRRADGAPGQGPRVPRRPARHRCARRSTSSAWCWSARSTASWSARSTRSSRSRSGSRARTGACSRRRQVDPALGFVGKVGKVRAGLLHALLDDGLIPIVSTVGADTAGQPYNVNADDAARAIAVAMGAEKLIYLTGDAGPARRSGRHGEPGPPPVDRRSAPADRRRRA